MRATPAFVPTETVHECTFPCLGVSSDGKPIVGDCSVCGEAPPTFANHEVARDLVLAFASAHAR